MAIKFLSVVIASASIWQSSGLSKDMRHIEAPVLMQSHSIFGLNRPMFKEGNKGDSACPDGFFEIKDEAECNDARKEIGLKRFLKQRNSKKKSRLPYCWIKNGRANFNANGDIGKRKRIRKSSLICKSAPCICTQQFKPVCGGNGITYGNACEASCDGATWSPGPCKPEPCICTEQFEPVCGEDGTTYGNGCKASCDGVKWTPGPCVDCDTCPGGYNDGCNDCRCSSSGLVGCTRRFCATPREPACLEPEPECTDGEVDKADPCTPRHCIRGTWIVTAIDCLVHFGGNCTGQWIPVEGECCPTCEEEPIGY